MTEKKSKDGKNIILFSYSILTIFAFQMKLNQVELADTTVTGIFLGFLKSFREYNVFSLFLVFILFWFYKNVSAKMQENNRERCFALLPAVLFAFFIVVGYSYECTDSWDLIICNNVLQWFKVIVSISGYMVFFYYCIGCIFHKVNDFNMYISESEKHRKILLKYLKVFERKPALVSFITLFIFYIPYIVVSYPATFCPDAVSQIIQAYAELGYYAPEYTSQLAIQEGIYLNNHHPVIFTLLIHVCLEIGKFVFASYNMGIFICALMQMSITFISIAILIQLLFALKIRREVCLVVLMYYIISPRIQSYMFFITKDVIFSAFVLIFIICLFQISRDNVRKKYYLPFYISISGCVLFRNDGKYLIILSLIIAAILCKKLRKKMIVCTGGVILFSIIYLNAVLPAFHVIPGSIREVMSIPFQQTARYLRYSGTPITQEEKKAISSILDYDAIIEKYEPERADSVKGTFNNKATYRELKEYFQVWLQMFLKHPSHYIQATINNTYYYFYPGSIMAAYNSYQFSTNNMSVVNNRGEKIGMNFSYPEALKKYQETYEQLREGIASLPVISALISSASYIWILILLVFYCIKSKSRKALMITGPLCVQVLICLAGPCNGWYFRYVYPIVICLPAVILICLHIEKSELKEKCEESEG